MSNIWIYVQLWKLQAETDTIDLLSIQIDKYKTINNSNQKNTIEALNIGNPILIDTLCGYAVFIP